MMLYELLHGPAGPIAAALLIILSLAVIYLSLKSIFTPSDSGQRSPKPKNSPRPTPQRTTQPRPVRRAELPPPRPTRPVVKPGPSGRTPPPPTPRPGNTRRSIYDFPKCPLCRLRNIRGSEQTIFSTPNGYRCRSGHEF